MRFGVLYGFIAIVALGLFAQAYMTIKPALHVAVVSSMAIGLLLVSLREPQRKAIGAPALFMAITMPVIAWSLTNIWLLFAAMLILVPLVARQFHQIVPVYLFSMLLLPALDTPVMIGGLKLVDISVHDTLAIGATAAIWFNPRKARPLIQYDVTACSVILLLAAAFARETSFSNHVRSSLNVLIDLGLPYYIASRGIKSIDDLRAGVLWMGTGAMALAGILIYELWRVWPVYNMLYGNYSLPSLLMVKARGGYLRASGPFVEPTSVAMVLAICVLALWLSRHYFRSPRFHLLCMSVAVFGLFAPQSRGAWVGLLLAIGISEAFKGNHVRLARKVIVLGIAGAGVLLVAQSSPKLSESLGLSGESTQTSDYRKMLFNRGVEEFVKRPVLGASVPRLLATMTDLRQGEGMVDFVNTYIWIALISGIVGLIIFIGAFLFFMVMIWQRRRRLLAWAGAGEVATFLFACLAMLLEMLFFTSFGTRPAVFVFVIFGFSAALLEVFRKSEGVAPSPTVAPGQIGRVGAMAL
jgi:hypothetical protein